MNIIIFGASGKLGSIVTKKALNQGHRVTAFVRQPTEINKKHPRLQIAVGDIYKPQTVQSALANQNIVISTLGRPLFKTSPLICRDGIEAILAGMAHHKVNRLLAISAFGAREHRHFSLYTRLLRLSISKHMRDKDQMEELIRASSVIWTLIRPAAYFDSWPHKGYKIEPALKGFYPVVTRNAIAECLLAQIKTTANQALAVRSD